MEIQRGHIYLVDFNPSKASETKVGSEILKRRPALVLTRNAFNNARRTVVVVPLSSSPRAAPPLVVSVPSAGEQSVAMCDQVTAINKATRIERHIGKLAANDLRAVESAVREVLGLES